MGASTSNRRRTPETTSSRCEPSELLTRTLGNALLLSEEPFELGGTFGERGTLSADLVESADTRLLFVRDTFDLATETVLLALVLIELVLRLDERLLLRRDS